MASTIIARCPCGATHITCPAKSIVSVVCYCTDCQAAATALAALPDGWRVMDADGGTPLALFPKKHLQFHDYGGRLRAHYRTPNSPTRRLVCNQCNSQLCLDSTKGPWLSVSVKFCTAPKPMPNMRIMTRSRPTGQGPLPGDMRNFAKFPARLMLPLVASWAKGGFRVVKLPEYPGLDLP